MLRRTAWVHILLAAYLWLVAAVPLGNWNRQWGQYLVPALLHGKTIGPNDIGSLVFVALPAVFATLAWWRRSSLLLITALIWDLIWLAMQIQSWWIPYAFGNGRRWQLDYVKGPNTKILPSFGRHVAPDALHCMITVLLLVAIPTGLLALRQLRRRLRTSALSHAPVTPTP